MEIKPFLSAREFIDNHFKKVEGNGETKIELDHDSALKLFNTLVEKGIKVEGTIEFFTNVGKFKRMSDKLDEAIENCHPGFRHSVNISRYYVAPSEFSPAFVCVEDIFDIEKIKDVCNVISSVLLPRKYGIKCYSIKLNRNLFMDFDSFDGIINKGLGIADDEKYRDSNYVTFYTNYKQLVK